MRLTSLELYGFKSFNQRTEILFPKKITGIVGPNGSGKSNIADAVRWVLGEQNPRLLRGGKMEDVIFNGTQTKKAMNFCEVSLLFDNSDKSLHPDYNEIMVTRRVYRSGESEYEINKTPCRLKDIVQMFSDTGIGKEGYSIIGQGRIDEILSRNTEDRRAVFEEAAGISYYKIQKREAESRLKRAEENLQRINDIANEQQNLLEPLKLQAEAAKSFLTLSNGLKEISAAIFLFEYDRLSSRKSTLNNNFEDIKKELSDYEYSLNELNISTESLQQLSLELEESCSQAAEETILAEREYSRLKEQYTSLSAKTESLESNMLHYKSELERISDNEAKLNEEISKGSSGKEEAKNLLDSASEELRITEEKYNNILAEVESLYSKSETLKTKLLDAINASSITESGRSRQKAIKEQMQLRCDELKELQSKAKVANLDVYNNYKNIENSLNEEKDRLTKLKENSDEINSALETVIFNIREKRSAAQECSEYLSSIISKHKTMTDMAYDFEGYAYAVKHALTSARSKGLSGVYGTVANIIKVPKEYETAIDMVLGGSLQHIVTDNEDDAKILINELRSKQAGRATFLPISSVKSFNISTADKKFLNHEGCIGVASELLSFNEKYKGVIENLLGKTL
ncbi:MAG: AAA family ATPase, partial [Christensenellaceae bacterium]|nr:AAA family ATPase [Christensenellaceae bacterium]